MLKIKRSSVIIFLLLFVASVVTWQILATPYAFAATKYYLTPTSANVLVGNTFDVQMRVSHDSGAMCSGRSLHIGYNNKISFVGWSSEGFSV